MPDGDRGPKEQGKKRKTSSEGQKEKMENGRFNLLNGSSTYLRGRITNQWGAEEEERRFRINLVLMRAHRI